MQVLQIHAGPAALRLLRERRLVPEDVAVIPGAAGGPKGLVLGPLDRYLFGQWLAGSSHTVHLLGASIGAWRLATACLADPVDGFRQLTESYVNQRYHHEPGRAPKAAHVSAIFGGELDRLLGASVAQILAHPRYRLHVFTSRGRHLLGRQGSLRTPLGYLGAYATNALSRKAMGGWLERVIFSDPREPLPLQVQDFRTRIVGLDAQNFRASLLASCSIPFWLDAVHDIPGAPRGAYWDGGITDYHLHLDYASMRGGNRDGVELPRGIVLYPHFQPNMVPGWLDKALRHRHRATAMLDNVVVISPHPQWIATLPNGKLPDRTDLQRHGADVEGRARVWRLAVAESERLAETFANWLDGRTDLPLQPLR
ncbi:phospholipase [Piscinibacter sakaiensis]|uniref:phospholipase n=1 Tax=Piscinibacter sakaiensis TaxID=1547922 RepID=UPI003AAD0D2A